MIINVTWEVNITVKVLKDYGDAHGTKKLNNVKILSTVVTLVPQNNVSILIALGITLLNSAQI